MNTTLNIRIDSKLKEKAGKKFKAAGMNISSGMKNYLIQVANDKVDLGPKMHYEMTPKQEKWVKAQVTDAMKNSKGYKTAKEMFDDILKD